MVMYLRKTNYNLHEYIDQWLNLRYQANMDTRRGRFDTIVLFCGVPGSGKSTFCQMLAAKVAPLNPDVVSDFCFSMGDFKRMIRTKEPMSNVILDEAIVLDLHPSSAEMRDLKRIITQCRSRRLFIWMCVPDYWVLPEYILKRVHGMFYMLLDDENFTFDKDGDRVFDPVRGNYWFYIGSDFRKTYQKYKKLKGNCNPYPKLGTLHTYHYHEHWNIDQHLYERIKFDKALNENQGKNFLKCQNCGGSDTTVSKKGVKRCKRCGFMENVPKIVRGRDTINGVIPPKVADDAPPLLADAQNKALEDQNSLL